MKIPGQLSAEINTMIGSDVAAGGGERPESRRILQLDEAETVTWTRVQICLC